MKDAREPLRHDKRKFIDELLTLAEASEEQQHRRTARRTFIDGLLALSEPLSPKLVPEMAEQRFEDLVIARWDDIKARVEAGVASRMASLGDSTRAGIGLLGRRPSLLSPIGKTRDEVSHSRLMAWLLGLDSELGLRARRAFADVVGADDIPEKDWRVRAEHQVADGCRIDVSIEVPGRWCCFVEMKVDAMERDKQLSDYADALQSIPGPVGMDRQLVFLTPKGRDSSERGVRYAAPLSFEALVAAWLPLTLEEGGESNYLGMWLRTITESVLEVSGDGPPNSWPLSQQLQIIDLLGKGRTTS